MNWVAVVNVCLIHEISFRKNEFDANLRNIHPSKITRYTVAIEHQNFEGIYCRLVGVSVIGRMGQLERVVRLLAMLTCHACLPYRGNKGSIYTIYSSILYNS